MTLENFVKAMEKADLELLKQTESNLSKSNDKARLDAVQAIIVKKEELTKKRGK